MAQSLNRKAAIVAGLVAGLVFMMLEWFWLAPSGGKAPGVHRA